MNLCNPASGVYEAYGLWLSKISVVHVKMLVADRLFQMSNTKLREPKMLAHETTDKIIAKSSQSQVERKVLTRSRFLNGFHTYKLYRLVG